MQREKRLALMAGWEKSGQTKKAYCESQGIKYARFIYWFKSEKKLTEQEEQLASGKFVELSSTSSAPFGREQMSDKLEVILPNGVRLLGLSKLDLPTLQLLSHV